MPTQNSLDRVVTMLRERLNQADASLMFSLSLRTKIVETVCNASADIRLPFGVTGLLAFRWLPWMAKVEVVTRS
jgi:hypothetical protein